MKLKKLLTIFAIAMIVLMAGCKKDDENINIGPNVSSTDPINEVTSVGIESKISAIFSTAMDPSTITIENFTLYCGTENVLGVLEYSGTTATFTPSVNLKSNSNYTATISNRVKDISGNSMVMDYTWSFSTGAFFDMTLPTVTLTNPLNNAINVSHNKVIAINFSEAMDSLTINSSTFTLKQGATSISGTVSYFGTVATITPSKILDVQTTYTATITTGAMDLAGNALAVNTEWSFTTGNIIPSLTTVELAGAYDFAILAGSAITNTGATNITGNLGLSPGSSVGGFPPGILNGVLHINDTIVNQAKRDLTTAFNDAAGRTYPDIITLSGNIGGLTLTPGLYMTTSSLAISSGDLTLDAQGDPSAVFIIQIASSLTTTSGRKVFLSGGAQASNVFWQVGSSATFGTSSVFKGTVLAMQSITLKTGATLDGRALARTGGVTMEGNTIVRQ